MKRQIKKTILAIVILVILAISQAVSAAPLHPLNSGTVSQFVYDNFDDNYTDPVLWMTGQQGGPTVSEVNQRLEITLPANSAGEFYAMYSSVCQLRGDYDIQVDYQLLTWPYASGIRIGLADNHVNMQRASFGQQNDYPGGPDVYFTNFDTADHVVNITPTSDLSGKLRLKRAGDTLASFYDANGVWMPIASNTDPTYTQDTGFMLSSWSGESAFGKQEVKIAFDNLVINAGELVCPPVDVPSVTINQAPGQADPTSGSPVLFTVTFSEPVTGFGDAAADVTVSGAAGATTATVTEIAPNDGTTYSVAVSGMTASGTVIASIPAGVAIDALNNANAASTSSDNTVSFTYVPTATGQVTPHTATCEQFAARTALDLDTVTYTVTASPKNPKVGAIEPISFYYYSKVIAPAANFQIRVVQSVNIYNWPSLFILQNYLFDSNCTVLARNGGTVTGNYIDFHVTNATPGAPYYVRIRYLANSVMGATVPSPYPAVPYRFTTILNIVNTIRPSIDTVTFQP